MSFIGNTPTEKLLNASDIDPSFVLSNTNIPAALSGKTINSSSIGAMAPSTGAFTTGTFGTDATGLSIQAHTGGGLAAIYSRNVIPAADNYSFITQGSNTYINGSVSSGLAIAGASIATATSTGLAVTGTMACTDYTETIYTPAASTAFTVALTNGSIQKLTTSGNVTITLPTSVTGKSYLVMVAYGGAHTVTWAGGSTIKWSGGTAPTATSVNGKVDFYAFTCDGTNTYGRDGGRNF